MFSLSVEDLFQVAKWFGLVAGQDLPELEEEDQEGCFHYNSYFTCSKQLFELEDSGIVELPILKGYEAISNWDLFLWDETRGVTKLYITGDTTISPPQTVLVTDTDDTARQSEAAHVARRVRPMTTKAVSFITNVVLQEMLISFQELGRKLRQSIIVPTAESPPHSKLANPIGRF